MNKGKKVLGFSLIEAVLAIGIFFVTILVLVSMLGPMLESVNDVKTSNELVSVVQSTNTFFDSNTNLAIKASNFDLIYEAVKTNGFATLYVFKSYTNNQSTDIKLSVGFSPSETTSTTRMDKKAVVKDFANAAGPIYRIIVTLNPLISKEFYKDRGISASPRFILTKSVLDFDEHFLPLNIDIFIDAPGTSFVDKLPYKKIKTQQAIFSFSTGINR